MTHLQFWVDVIHGEIKQGRALKMLTISPRDYEEVLRDYPSPVAPTTLFGVPFQVGELDWEVEE